MTLMKSINMYDRAHEAHENNRGVAHDKLTDSKQFYYKTKEDSQCFCESVFLAFLTQ